MLKWCALLAAALVLVAHSPAGCGAVPSRNEVRRVVDGAILPLMKKNGIPGMAIALVVAGRPYVFDYGVASLATRNPVTADTLFELGSVSKTFTATLAALADAQGLLSLSDTVGEFLPPLHGHPFGKVTLLELGTHTPGGVPLQVPEEIQDETGLMRYLETWHATHPPGTERTYSNIGIGLLGLIVAGRERKPFADLMRQQVLDPLGMHHTWYHVPASDMAYYAQGYTAGGAPIRVAPGVLDEEAYGIKTTAGDMLRFLEANMGMLKPDAPFERAIAIAQTGYFKAGPLVQDLIWEQYPYPVPLKTLQEGNSPGMIFDAVPATRLAPPTPPKGNVWIDKTGSTNGFSAYVALIPGKRLGIVILANKSYPIEDRVAAAYRILAALDDKG